MKFETYIVSLRYINRHLSEAALLGQLAEEAAELAQAALKYQRIHMNENPTPVNENEAACAFYEELGDVLCCVDAILYPYCKTGHGVAQVNAQRKAIRWAERLFDKLHPKDTAKTGEDANG